MSMEEKLSGKVLNGKIFLSQNLKLAENNPPIKC